MITHKSHSLADQVYEQLEGDILSGKYKKGEIITENKISEALGVSRTPVREAMRRLAHEHMIEESGKGSVIIGISPEDMLDVFEVRIRVEGLATARAAERITEKELKELKEALEMQEFYTYKDDPEHIRNTDTAFHKIIYRCCGSTTLYDTLMPMHKKVRKYRRVSVTHKDRAKKSIEEHKAIYEALLNRDSAAAEKAAVEHIKNAKENILRTEAE